MTTNDKYTRRALLSRLGGAGAVAALSPFIPYTEAEAAQSAKPRYVYWFTPINPARNLADPVLPASTAEESPLVFRGMYEALNTMSSKMSLYRGLTNNSRLDGDLSGGHKDATVSMLVGTPCKKGKIGGGTAIEGAGLNGASSIDQFIARELKKQGVNTPITDLRFGWQNPLDAINTNSFLDGKEMLRHQNPAAMFKQMFQFSGTTSGAGNNQHQKSILDFVYKDVKAIQPKLTAMDRERLDDHLGAIEEAQRLIDASNNAGSCSIPASLEGSVNRLDLAVQAYIKLLVIAFGCDMTRVAGGMFLPYQAGTAYHDVPDFNLIALGNKVNATYHSATHGMGGSAADVTAFIQGVQKYRAKIYIDLLTALNAVKEPTGGTLLDSSIVHWYVEISRDHSVADLFNLIGGGAGHFKMGKQFIVGGKTSENRNAPQNMLLTSIANAMGIPITNYGAYNSGPIPSKYLV